MSILIPARNEEATIKAALDAALASCGVQFEIVVLDDHSQDATAGIVREVAKADARVMLISAPPLPPGWAGKQHACFCLAEAARYDHLLFIDADVRLHADGAARLMSFRQLSHADLVSGVPRQLTETWLEKLIVPLIHFLLLGYLPLWIMRQLNHPALAAGCGQLFLTTRMAYERAGGHEAIRESFHDGLQLPRAYRRAGLRTDLCDATSVASCRMYHGEGELWQGLAKNAGEGMGSPRGIVFWTIVLGVGQVLPFLMLAAQVANHAMHDWFLVVACGLSWFPRIVAAGRFRQSWIGAVLHPIGITVLLAIQWFALIRRIVGRPIGWKGRTQPIMPISMSDAS